MAPAGSAVTTVLQGLGGMRARLEDCYRDLHAHPELSH
jgi:hippurate hydrolase